MSTRAGVPVGKLRDDAYLEPFFPQLDQRRDRVQALRSTLTGDQGTLADFASGHEYYGIHRSDDGGWVIREWAPNATGIKLFGDACDWQTDRGWAFDRINEKGDWELHLAADQLGHGDLFRLFVQWDGGQGERLPSYARRVVQDEHSKVFSAQVWSPPEPYVWRHERPENRDRPLLIYEAHVGIAQEEGKVGSYDEFREHTLPRIAKAGYTAIQLMAVMEHPYYGSFGYHVANFFAASSRFGTPEALKALVDAVHAQGLAVIMDIVHSHAVKNEQEGLSLFDGTPYQYFHEGPRGNHDLWDSRCFDYTKPEVLHFLLSNCRYWLDEFRFDGYRFDGVTSMLYTHHGFGTGFGVYESYFDDSVDEDAYSYLALANEVIHETVPQAITIAEDVRGMPGLGADIAEGGCGFDYRLAMGVPDFWFKLIKESKDEAWNPEGLLYELTNRRHDERIISYVESHDQALVGGKSFFFELVDAEIYESMSVDSQSLVIERGMAIHKMARLITLATAAHGYLNFIGNEFGHPEWIDFPREGNQWSYHYARRQWSLRDRKDLRYHFLADFDEAIITLLNNASVFQHYVKPIASHISDQWVAFERGDYLFVFNFNPTQSFADLAIPWPHKALLVLDSDAANYGGHSRLETTQRFYPNNGNIHLYVPSRSALVLEKMP